MKPNIDSASKVLRDSPLGCGPTTRGLQARTGGQFWWGLVVLGPVGMVTRVDRRFTGYGGETLVGKEGQVHVLAATLGPGLTFWRLQ